MTPEEELHEAEAFDAAQEARWAHPDALRHAALFYATIGLPVFPLAPGGKRPLIPSAHPDGDPARGTCMGECGRRGHGLYDATTDPGLIAAWWVREPQANIGIRTGVLVDVIDIDGPAGFASLRVMRERGTVPPVLGQARTTRPDFGAHLYIAPTGKGNAAHLAPGVDYRGAGGYVVAPPSLRADNGRRWLWTTPLNLTALA